MDDSKMAAETAAETAGVRQTGEEWLASEHEVAARAERIRELRRAARGIDHSLADLPDYERFDAAVAAIEEAARVTPPGLREADVVAAMESVLGDDEVSTYDGSMSVDRAARLVYAALSDATGTPEPTRCLCGGSWPCPDRNAPNYRPEAYAEHGPA